MQSSTPISTQIWDAFKSLPLIHRIELLRCLLEKYSFYYARENKFINWKSLILATRKVLGEPGSESLRSKIQSELDAALKELKNQCIHKEITQLYKTDNVHDLEAIIKQLQTGDSSYECIELPLFDREFLEANRGDALLIAMLQSNCHIKKLVVDGHSRGLELENILYIMHKMARPIEILNIHYFESYDDFQHDYIRRSISHYGLRHLNFIDAYSSLLVHDDERLSRIHAYYLDSDIEEYTSGCSIQFQELCYALKSPDCSLQSMSIGMRSAYSGHIPNTALELLSNALRVNKSLIKLHIDSKKLLKNLPQALFINEINAQLMRNYQEQLKTVTPFYSMNQFRDPANIILDYLSDARVTTQPEIKIPMELDKFTPGSAKRVIPIVKSDWSFWPRCTRKDFFPAYLTPENMLTILNDAEITGDLDFLYKEGIWLIDDLSDVTFYDLVKDFNDPKLLKQCLDFLKISHEEFASFSTIIKVNNKKRIIDDINLNRMRLKQDLLKAAETTTYDKAILMLQQIKNLCGSMQFAALLHATGLEDYVDLLNYLATPVGLGMFVRCYQPILSDQTEEVERKEESNSCSLKLIQIKQLDCEIDYSNWIHFKLIQDFDLKIPRKLAQLKKIDDKKSTGVLSQFAFLKNIWSETSQGIAADKYLKKIGISLS